jgi:hypothetical protein
MKFAEFKQDSGAQRKMLIFGAVVLGATGWLILPSFSGHKDAAPVVLAVARGRTVTHAAVNPPPVPPTAPGVVAAAAPVIPGVISAVTPPPAALPDPFAPVLGRWQGSMQTPARGICNLVLTVRENKTERPFEGYSTLSCVPGMMAILAQASKDGGRNISPAEMMERVSKLSTPTSATFAGQAQDGAIEFKSIDNIGVVENKNNCTMLSMTVREFADGISVKWHEAEGGNCHGGEMVMTRR